MNDEAKWLAVTQRDATQDGKFFYGVTTTGVFCRPSCASRLPLRKNVRFYTTPAAAAKDGLRACRRCRPLEQSSRERIDAKIREICRYIDEHAGQSSSTSRLSLEELSRKAGISAFHFQRNFKRVIGITPKKYVEAARLKLLKTKLRSGASVTDATYDVGFGSGSRVYERVDTRLGMTPKQYRDGGKGIAISYASSRSPLGTMLIGATDRGLCFIQFGTSKTGLIDELAREYPGATLTAMDPERSEVFAGWMQALTDYLDGSRAALDLPLDIRGTAFQMKVWDYLQRIPYGEVQSYAEVASGIGKPAAVRAVANACASNRVALAIPCHRVIRGDGSLGGYRWGLERKRTLIDQERAHARDGVTR
jgi:AraC family transcriptional regulator of adaptative response/methylated-DNA-[protein]-cysteine methyltransferase